MSDLKSDSLLAYAKKVSSAIYLACDSVVADDVARTLRALVAEVERVRTEAARAARDTERLDWLARHSTFYASAIEFDHGFLLAEHLPTLRAALEASIQSQVPAGDPPNPRTSTGAE